MWPFINHKANGWNKTGIALALLAILEQHTRSVPARPLPPPLSSPSNPPRASVTLAALPLGATLFALHSLLSDASTLLAWAWTGYASRAPLGPFPHRWAPLTIAAMALGLAFGVLPKMQRVTRNPVWFATGAWCAWVMYAKSGWEGYTGGLGYAVFLMLTLPLAFGRAAAAARTPWSRRAEHGKVEKDPKSIREEETELNVAHVYTGAMGVYCALNVASIFTVAYAFVPGGVYLRERTDL